MADNGRPRALFLAPEAPYPLNGGGALRSASLLQYLARSYDVEVVVFREPRAPDPAKQIPPGLARRICVIDLPEHRRTLPARRLRNLSRMMRRTPPLVDRFSGFGRQVNEFVAGRHYSIGIIEHFWCAPYWEQLAPVCDRTVLNLHNIESVLHQRCAAVDRGATALAHRVFGAAAEKLEREWLPRFTRILAASAQDETLVRSRAPGARVGVYPNAIPLPPWPSAAREEALVFSGNLEYHPNISAVRFFRRQVWPAVREQWPRLVWRLIGKNPEAVRPWTSGDPRITVCGPVQDAIAELARAQIAVVPLLTGSGTRLKILEAWGAGLPVVSTPLGAEGLPVQDGREILLADGAAPFAAAISRLLQDAGLREELGRRGRALLERDFTWERAWESLNL